MIKIKLASPFFFGRGGGVGLGSDYLAKGRPANALLLMFLFAAYCVILHMDATNALIDSQAMVERMVCYITVKPAGDNL